MSQEYITKSIGETKKLAEKLAREILNSRLYIYSLANQGSRGAKRREVLKKRPKNQAFVIGLAGELGGGKTTFLQGFAQGLGIKEKILSPTFVIMKRFKISKIKTFYHIDCYRIKKPKELLDLGFKEIISNPQNIVCIEWADQIRKIMPKNTTWIRFEFINEKKRKIMIKYD